MTALDILLKILVPLGLFLYVGRVLWDRHKVRIGQTRGDALDKLVSAVQQAMASDRTGIFRWIPAATAATLRALWPRGVALAAALALFRSLSLQSNILIKNLLSINYDFAARAAAQGMAVASPLRAYWHINWSDYWDDVIAGVFPDMLLSSVVFVLSHAASAFSLLLALITFVIYAKSRSQNPKPYFWVPLFAGIIFLAGFATGLYRDYQRYELMVHGDFSLMSSFLHPSLITMVFVQSLTISFSMHFADILHNRKPLSGDSLARSFSKSWFSLVLYAIVFQALMYFYFYFLMGIAVTGWLFFVIHILLLFVPFFAFFSGKSFLRAVGASVRFAFLQPLTLIIVYAYLAALYLAPFLLKTYLDFLSRLWPVSFSYWLTPFIDTLWYVFLVIFMVKFFKDHVAPVIAPEPDAPESP